MNLDKGISKAMDAFYWGDIGPDAKDEYGSGYKLLEKDEATINLVGEVLHTLQSENENLKADLALAKEELIAERKKNGRS